MLREMKKTSFLYKTECFRRFARIVLANAMLPRPMRPKSKGQFKVGMIKRGGIGDWIIFAPALEQLRTALQGQAVEVTVYTEKRQEGIAAMIGLFDRVILFDQATRKGLFRRHRLLAGLRREQFDLWIDADISRTNVGDAMSLASAAKVRVGYAANADSPCHAMIESRAFTHTIQDNLGQVHMRERFEHLLAFSATLAMQESSFHSAGGGMHLAAACEISAGWGRKQTISLWRRAPVHPSACGQQHALRNSPS